MTTILTSPRPGPAPLFQLFERQTPTKVDSKNILLVEDNQGDVRLVREALAGLPDSIDLSVEGDGLGAMHRLQGTARKPDLILLDLNLPRMDGRSFLGWIKADPVLRRIPVVVLTTSDAPRDVSEAYDLHANCYLVKPSSLDDFESMLHSTVGFWTSLVRLPKRS